MCMLPGTCRRRAALLWDRYRLRYVPFIGTLRSAGWLQATSVGLGPDYFPLHLLQARRQLPNGAAIPLALVWALPSLWAILLAASVWRLRAG